MNVEADNKVIGNKGFSAFMIIGRINLDDFAATFCVGSKRSSWDNPAQQNQGERNRNG
jgi:hypothetical protein